MAFKRFAKALVEKPDIGFDQWTEEIRNNLDGVVPRNHVAKVAKNVLRKCDPKQYLLSHATIVASVDTVAPKGVKTGKFMNRGVQCERRWPDFRIKADCQDLVNNNGDAWSRPLLLATYRTFIGAHNFLEHIQLPELSKGFIVDAIVRDLGKTCYVDILVATNRKHQMLVQDITTGKMTGLSMGCISLFTICTKCGNVASDDSQLCPCITLDGKGSKYFDESGQELIVSELIGHVSVPNSNQFIEASWVKNPAFKGAQRRNFLNQDTTAVASAMVESAKVYDLRRDIVDFDCLGFSKAASTRRLAEDDPAPAGDERDELDAPPESGGDDDSGGEEAPSDDKKDSPSDAGAAPEASSGDNIDKMLEKAQELLLETLVKGLADKIAPKPEDVGTAVPSTSDVLSGNDNIVRSSEDFARLVSGIFKGHQELIKWSKWAYSTVHTGGIKAIRSSRMTPQELIVLSWIEDTVRGQKFSPDLYRLSMRVGPMSSFPSEASYLASCSLSAGRRLSASESQFMTWKGRIASLSINF